MSWHRCYALKYSACIVTASIFFHEIFSLYCFFCHIKVKTTLTKKHHQQYHTEQVSNKGNQGNIVGYSIRLKVPVLSHGYRYVLFLVSQGSVSRCTPHSPLPTETPAGTLPSAGASTCLSKASDHEHFRAAVTDGSAGYGGECVGSAGRRAPEWGG